MEREFAVEDVFSLRRPKDIKAGIASGLKSVAKGVVGGTVGLLAAPAVGAVQEGLPGFAKGIAAGAAGAVLLPVTGATVAAIQVARGIVNQPEAIAEGIRGKTWNQEQRCWVEQQRSAITPYDAAAGLHWHRLGITGVLGHRQQQPDYYELLEVSRTATAEEIKRQYYKLARKHHPDKNVGDEAAHQRFQQLGEAYQVLSNAQLRQQYDQFGVEGVHADLMDSAAFFACLFGSEMFDHLVGELAIATVARLGEAVCPAELQEAQAQRVQQLAVYLTALLKRYEEGDEGGFKLAMQQEAERLAAASFGATLLHCIGEVYTSQADVHLGGLWGGTRARLRRGTQSLRSHLNVANAALKVLAHQDKVAAFERDCQQRRQQQQQEQEQQQQQQEQQEEACQALHRQDTEQQNTEQQNTEQQNTEQQNTEQQGTKDQYTEQQQQQYEQPAGVPSAGLLYDAVWFGDGHADVTDHRAGHFQQQMQHQQTPSAAQQPLDAYCVSSSGDTADSDTSTPHHVDTPTVSLQYEALLESLPFNGHSQAASRSCGPTSTAAASSHTTHNSDWIGNAANDCTNVGNQDPGITRCTRNSQHPPGVGEPAAAAAGNCADNELLQQSELEELSIRLCMEAMWAANVVDIQQTLGKVCQAVLFKPGSSHAVRQLRAHALRELGGIFCSVSERVYIPQVHPKHQVQAAYEAMLARHLARDNAMQEEES